MCEDDDDDYIIFPPPRVVGHMRCTEVGRFERMVAVVEAARAVTRITHAGATGLRAWDRLKKAVAALDAD